MEQLGHSFAIEWHFFIGCDDVCLMTQILVKRRVLERSFYAHSPFEATNECSLVGTCGTALERAVQASVPHKSCNH